MTTVLEKSTVKDRLIAAVNKRLPGLPVGSQALQQEALEQLDRLEFPTTKNEEWKYSNVKPILDLDFSQEIPDRSVPQEILNTFIINPAFNLLVFVNGLFSKEQSVIKENTAGLVLGSLREYNNTHAAVLGKHLGLYAPVAGEAFTALNTAYVADGAFVYVPSGIQVQQAVQILFITTADQVSVTQTRVLLVCEENSAVNIIETYHSLGASKNFTNAVTEISCGENARMEHYKIQLENNNAYHIGTTCIHQQKSSLFNSYVFTLDGGFVRNNLTVALDAQGIESHLFGLYLPNQSQHVDNHTLVDHKMPNCNSNEIYKGIIDDKGTGVFNGKIFVRKDAQKTNAFQSNKNILLSDFARMDSKPQLEIFADDVKCSHGSTTGQFDEDALFYMRARGIGEEKAKNLLMHAFASEIIEAVKTSSLKGYLYSLLSARLEHDFT
jgi:Fe-S cluster assembly protein SufD